MKPTIKVYVGRPVFGTEANSVRRLNAELLKRGIDALLLINFTVKSRQIDCVVVTAKQAILLDFKEITGPVRGGVNGPWFIRSHGGTDSRYPGENPYVEVSSAKYALSNEMDTFQQCGKHIPRPNKKDFYREFNAAVCICPEIAAGSSLPPGDFKCWIWGFPTTVDAICTGKTESSWHVGHWERFATEHLGLESVSLEGATDPAFRRAELTLAAYRKDLTGLLSHSLPPALPDFPEELPHDEHFVLVGPSGIGKTTRLQHHALGVGYQNVLVLFLEAMHYTGEFRGLLQKGVAPSFQGRIEDLRNAASICGATTLLIIDGFDRCKESLRPSLVNDIAAFHKLCDCRVVVASQFDPNLPPAIKCKTVQMQKLTTAQKLSVFRFHSGDSAFLDQSQLEPFETSHDLMVAGQCKSKLTSKATRSDMYDAYVAQSLPRSSPTVAGALCRHLAAFLSRELSAEMSFAEFEKESERFLKNAGTPLLVVDELRQSKLVRIGSARFSFSHQQIQDHLYGDWLCRNVEDFDTLVSELCKPAHRHLAETAIVRQKSPENVRALIRSFSSVDICERALQGQMGEIAKQVVSKDVHMFLSDAIADVANVGVDLKLNEENGKGIQHEWPELIGFRQWSHYESCLARLVGRSLGESSIVPRAIELFILTGLSLHAAVECEAQRCGVKVTGQFGRVLHIVLVLHKLEMQCPASEIFNSWRNSIMYGKTAEPAWIPALKSRLEGSPFGASAFILFALFEFYQRQDMPTDDLEDLFVMAWNAKIRPLRIQALQTLDRLAHKFLTGPSERLARVRSLLEQVGKHTNTEDLILNSTILETLNAYEMLSKPVESNQALEQMRGVLSPTSDYALHIIDAWKSFTVDTRDPLAEEANRLIGMFFEDVFQGVYFEAFQELSESEQVSFMNLAASAREPFGDLAFVLRGLVKVCLPSSAEVFRRYAERVLFDSWMMDQEKIEVFILAIIGCAKLGLSLPEWRGGDGSSGQSWKILRDIIFNHAKGTSAEGIEPLWVDLQAEAILGAADAMFMLRSAFGASAASQDEFSINLSRGYPQQVKAILEHSLQNRDKLTSASKFGESDHHVIDRTRFIIEELGNIGDASTLEVLKPLINDTIFGGSALSSFKNVKLRLRGSPQNS